MHGSRRTGPLAAGLTALALVLTVWSVRTAPGPEWLAQRLPVTALVTGVLLLAPPRFTGGSAVMLALGFFAANVIGGCDLVLAAGLGLANAVEALLVVRWLTGFQDQQAQLRSWTDYRRWLIGITVGSCAAGAVTAVTVGLSGGTELWRPFMWIAVTHLAAQTLLLPLFLHHPRQRVRVSGAELTFHLALVLVGATACLQADRSQPVAFLLLPLVMWSSARFRPCWANLELVAVVAGLGLLTYTGRGPFPPVGEDAGVLDISASLQTFVAVSAITSVGFCVAMVVLRESLRRIRQNELQLGQLLDSASGTAFVATDLDGTITWFSPGAEQLLGYTAAEVVGRSSPMPFHESREVLARSQVLGVAQDYGVVTHEVERGAEQETRDWTYVRKDGSRLTVSLSVTAVRDGGRASAELPERRAGRDRPPGGRAGPGLRPRQGA